MSATPLTSRRHRYTSGLTLVELVVAMTLIPLIIGIFIFSIYAGITSTQRSKIQIEIDTDLSVALDIVERDVRFAKAFHKTIPSRFSDADGPNGIGTGGSQAWNFRGVPESATSRVLILEVPSTTQSPLSNARMPVFMNSSDFNCSTQLSLNPELTHLVIYFMRDGVLNRRILTDTSSPVCGGAAQNQKQSCSSGVGTGCRANDERIAKNLTEFRINYYRALAQHPIANAYTSADPNILSTADDAEVEMIASRPFGSDPVTASIKLRIGMVNARHDN